MHYFTISGQYERTVNGIQLITDGAFTKSNASTQPIFPDHRTYFVHKLTVLLLKKQKLDVAVSSGGASGGLEGAEPPQTEILVSPLALSSLFFLFSHLSVHIPFLVCRKEKKKNLHQILFVCHSLSNCDIKIS